MPIHSFKSLSNTSECSNVSPSSTLSYRMDTKTTNSTLSSLTSSSASSCRRSSNNNNNINHHYNNNINKNNSNNDGGGVSVGRRVSISDDIGGMIVDFDNVDAIINYVIKMQYICSEYNNKNKYFLFLCFFFTYFTIVVFVITSE